VSTELFFGMLRFKTGKERCLVKKSFENVVNVLEIQQNSTKNENYTFST
jgi:hypothetical protein